jgi:two-component system, chemotaxis family, protein-glutamate methylesterase/glutaminase
LDGAISFRVLMVAIFFGAEALLRLVGAVIAVTWLHGVRAHSCPDVSLPFLKGYVRPLIHTSFNWENASGMCRLLLCITPYSLARSDLVVRQPLLMTKRNIIVVGASAGGVEALCLLFKSVPRDLKAAIFVVMHIGADSVLPDILSRCGKLPAIPAGHKMRYKRGCIHVAPPQHHLLIKDGVTVLSRGPRENGHRPAIDVLFRSAAREHRSKVIGIVLTGGRDDGSAGLFAIKSRGGIAIVQDPKEAAAPNMPQNALNMVDVDFCLPVRQIADLLPQLIDGKATNITESANGGANVEEQGTANQPTATPPGDQIPVACPECNGPIYEVRDGELAYFQCFVGHRFSPESLSDQHTDALERALWTAARTLKERIVLHEKLAERKRNKGEDELLRRLDESVTSAKKDLQLLREILDRI